MFTMDELSQNLNQLDTSSHIDKATLVSQIAAHVEHAGYKIVELNDQKPWGAYIRIDGQQADRFVAEFFPGLTPAEARLGVENAELSPKILIVAPAQRLSWQYHDRRAERWTFLTSGAYNKSLTDDEGELMQAKIGDVVQFAQSERHRLVGLADRYVIVAEIWQHTDSSDMSNEDDIVRLADDYKR
jgi:mannose-6-phosphate isomerase-like protein (cupin superfamily)